MVVFVLVPGVAGAGDSDAVSSQREETETSGDNTGNNLVQRQDSSLANAFAADPQPRFGNYLKDLYEPGVFLKTALSASFKHIRQSPKQWGGGSTGLNKRLRHVYAKRVVEKSIEHSVAAALGEILGYRRSGEKGFWPRTKHAIVSTFVTPREGGGRGLSYARLAGTTGSYFISNTWYPQGANGKSDALRRSGLSLSLDVGTNILKEFWPDLKEKLPGKKSPKSVDRNSKPPLC